MTVVLQAVSLLALLGLLGAWGFWVWDTQRPITSPEKLGEVVVHGVESEKAEAVARALAVGVVGAIAEHYRTVDFINTAAGTADEFLIRTGGSAPEPLLLQGKTDGERLDLSLEFAGAKIDSKGLSALFAAPKRQRGTLSLAVSFTPAGPDGQWRAVASASFPENGAYGFRAEAAGSLDEVADIIGHRFVQAHYAASDPFFAALAGADFRKLWTARRAAADLALKGASGDPRSDDPLRKEAEAVYREVAALLNRYRRRVELQKLGGYLASAQGDLEAARRHLAAARDVAQEAELASLDSLLASLDVDIANRNQRPGTAATATASLAAGEDLGDLLRQLGDANTALAPLNLAGLHSQYRLVRPPRIGLVIARPPAEWDGRIEYVGDKTAPAPEEFLTQYSVAVLSLIASMAPQAEIIVSPLTGFEGGGATTAGLDAARRALAGRRLDAVYWPFGPIARSYGKESGEAADSWADAVTKELKGIAGFGGLAVVPAGNEGLALPPVVAGASAPAHAVVGAVEQQGERTAWSNHGPGVTIYAPGQSTVLVEGGAFAEQQGTAFSGAALAAGAALVAATVDPPPDGARLLAALRESARPLVRGGPPVPDLAAAAAALQGSPGG